MARLNTAQHAKTQGRSHDCAVLAYALCRVFGKASWADELPKELAKRNVKVRLDGMIATPL